jgi:hypothetical protein
MLIFYLPLMTIISSMTKTDFNTRETENRLLRQLRLNAGQKAFVAALRRDDSAELQRLNRQGVEYLTLAATILQIGPDSSLFKPMLSYMNDFDASGNKRHQQPTRSSPATHHH